MPGTENIHEKVAADLEKAADAVFSGEASEGFEALAADPVAADPPANPESTDPPADPVDPPADPVDPPADPVDPPADPAKPADPPADPAKPAEPVKPAEVDLTPPEGLKEKAAERWAKLTTALKEKDTALAERETLVADLTERVTSFKTLLDQTGLDDREVLRVLDLGAQIKRDPEAAFGTLQGVLQGLAKQLGRKIETVDPLVDHPDLLEKVKKLDMSREDAEELAQARARKTAQDRKAASDRQTQELTDRQAQALDAARVEVAKFLGKAEAKDPDFAKAMPLLVKAAEFARKNLAPNLWLGYLTDQYDRIKEAAALAAPAAAPAAAPTPLVDKGPGGEKDRQVKTLGDLADVLL